MSKFRGHTFKVVPDGNDFPIISLSSGGWYTWTGTIKIDTVDTLNAMRQLITICTPKRPLGTIGVVIHIEAGRTIVSTLQVPKRGGLLQSVSAIMTKFDNIRVYGKPAGSDDLSAQFLVDVEFIVTTDPNA